MSSDQYDAILVGSGGGSLGASVVLANAGLKTLMLEKHSDVGGYITSFKRKGFCFEPAATILFSGEMIGMPHDMVGMRDKVNLDLMRAEKAGISIQCPGGSITFSEGMTNSQMIEQLWDLTPENASSDLNSFQRAEGEMFDEGLKKISMLDWAKDNSVSSSLLSLLSILGFGTFILPPSKIPANIVGMLSFLPSFMEFCFPKGGIISIARAYAKALELLGGEVRTKSAVSKILTKGDKVEGVQLESGEKIYSKLVISDVGIDNTVTKLIGADHFEKSLVERVMNLKPTLSCFCVFLGLDYIPDISPSTLSAASADVDYIEGLYSNLESGKFYESEHDPILLYIHVPSLEYPDMAPPGQSVMSVLVWAPYELAGGNWDEKKEHYSTVIIKALENRLLPGLSNHIVYRDAATPLTYERFVGKRGGAIMGWAPALGTEFLSGDFLPIEGLYCVGDSVDEALGMMGTIVRGARRAQEIVDPKAAEAQLKLGLFGL